MDLRDKTALVTGAALRIGRSLCLALAQQGCRLLIHYHRSGQAARALAAQLRIAGATAWLVSGDLRRPGCSERLITQAFKSAGTVDILINNAAVFYKQSLLDASAADWRLVWDSNLAAPLGLMRALARRRQRGQIINLLDSRVAAWRAGALPYTLSKKMLAELTRLAALELAPRFRVNGVAPGAILAPARPGGPREKAGRLPLRRRPTLDDLARAVIMLLQNDSITGQIIYVDSGQHLLGSLS